MSFSPSPQISEFGGRQNFFRPPKLWTRFTPLWTNQPTWSWVDRDEASLWSRCVSTIQQRDVVCTPRGLTRTLYTALRHRLNSHITSLMCAFWPTLLHAPTVQRTLWFLLTVWSQGIHTAGRSGSPVSEAYSTHPRRRHKVARACDHPASRHVVAFKFDPNYASAQLVTGLTACVLITTVRDAPPPIPFSTESPTKCQRTKCHPNPNSNLNSNFYMSSWHFLRWHTHFIKSLAWRSINSTLQSYLISVAYFPLCLWENAAILNMWLSMPLNLRIRHDRKWTK